MTGLLRQKQRKIFTMWMFSFEVDSLEIHLREVLGLVDVVFLVEATVTNQGQPKPLLWERVKNSQRFGFLREEGVMTRVVHLVVDDRMAGKKSSEVIWHAENRQTRLGVQGVKDWMQGRLTHLDDSGYWHKRDAENTILNT